MLYTGTLNKWYFALRENVFFFKVTSGFHNMIAIKSNNNDNKCILHIKTTNKTTQLFKKKTLDRDGNMYWFSV